MVIVSLSSLEVIPMSSEGRWEDLAACFLAGIRDLAAAGADFGALACNAGHLVFDELQRRSPIPLVSVVDTARDEAVRRGCRRVGLLGTAAAMDGDLYRKPLAEAGIGVVVPDGAERAFIADRIINELELGVVNSSTVEAFTRIIGRMASDEGIETVMLGCTELPLPLKGVALPVPALDTMALHIVALVDGILL